MLYFQWAALFSVCSLLQVAMAMAAKAKLLLRELKTVKADLAFAKDRCAQLEDENKILRVNRERGDSQDDDDLVCICFKLELEFHYPPCLLVTYRYRRLSSSAVCFTYFISPYDIHSLSFVNSFFEYNHPLPLFWLLIIVSLLWILCFLPNSQNPVLIML